MSADDRFFLWALLAGVLTVAGPVLLAGCLA